MANDKSTPAHPDAGSMLSQKTNEDFNKKKPTPNDLKKPAPNPEMPPRNLVPDKSEIRKRNRVDQNKGENKSEGSE